jgi:hypothetical protein
MRVSSGTSFLSLMLPKLKFLHILSQHTCEMIEKLRRMRKKLLHENSCKVRFTSVSYDSQLEILWHSGKQNELKTENFNNFFGYNDILFSFNWLQN